MDFSLFLHSYSVWWGARRRAGCTLMSTPGPPAPAGCSWESSIRKLQRAPFHFRDRPSNFSRVFSCLLCWSTFLHPWAIDQADMPVRETQGERPAYGGRNSRAGTRSPSATSLHPPPFISPFPPSSPPLCISPLSSPSLSTRLLVHSPSVYSSPSLSPSSPSVFTLPAPITFPHLLSTSLVPT